MKKQPGYIFTEDMSPITTRYGEVENVARTWVSDTLNWMNNNSHRRNLIREIFDMPGLQNEEVFEYICATRNISCRDILLNGECQYLTVSALQEIMDYGWPSYSRRSSQENSVYRFTESMRCITGHERYSVEEIIALECVTSLLEWLDATPDVHIATLNGAARISDIRWAQQCREELVMLGPEERDRVLATVYRIKADGWDAYVTRQSEPLRAIASLDDKRAEYKDLSTFRSAKPSGDERTLT